MALSYSTSSHSISTLNIQSSLEKIDLQTQSALVAPGKNLKFQSVAQAAICSLRHYKGGICPNLLLELYNSDFYITYDYSYYETYNPLIHSRSHSSVG